LLFLSGSGATNDKVEVALGDFGYICSVNGSLSTRHGKPPLDPMKVAPLTTLSPWDAGPSHDPGDENHARQGAANDWGGSMAACVIGSKGRLPKKTGGEKEKITLSDDN
jgi:hypothetical protein